MLIFGLEFRQKIVGFEFDATANLGFKAEFVILRQLQKSRGRRIDFRAKRLRPRALT